MDFTKWSEAIKMFEGNKVKRDAVDRCFKAANVQLEKIAGDDSNENALNRF